MRFGVREIIFTSILLGMVAGTYAMVVQPHARARREKLAEMRAMNRAISTALASTSGLEDVKRRVEQEQQATAFFGSRLAKATDLPTAVNELVQIATANSLQAGEVQILRGQSFPGVDARPVHLQLTGNFNGIYSFLLQLEGVPRIMRVSHLNLSESGDRDDQISADLTLTMYFAADGAAVAQAN
jgi:Tfp pilus assembly protein PilO